MDADEFHQSAGYCGTGDEYCGSSCVANCDYVGPVGECDIRRVVGYYEGWAPNRPCKAFWPEQIPSSVYTHLNYAFATIDPKTFAVMANNEREAGIMKRLVALKTTNPQMKVNIAIGGWAFNDPGSTATVFSDLAASKDNQNKFFASLLHFMSLYGFDGVDIDWEYPVDSDRGGRFADLKNFPSFMANLKEALNQGGATRELSLTLPTSYWYLQHFDIKGLEKSVDYFNYMSYDLHGTWDGKNQWSGAYLDSHTNLTEIEVAMDLLWRNNISPSKVVMGLAFYARAFTVADTSCTTPGCMFASGSDEGPCSGQTGILLNSEIDDIRTQYNVQPTLDKDAAVQILSWEDQWLTYDDSSTFKLKVDYVKDHCLGGVMVWAVSQDTSNGTYTEALSDHTPPMSAPHILLSVENTDGSLTLTKQDRKRQCTWVGCGEVCKSPYVAVFRGVGPGAGDGHSLMMDSVTCPTGQTHTLCCPEDHGVKCGWYTHNNGKCDSTCPSGTFEIGSVAKPDLCYNDDYQAACCTSGKDATLLYGTTTWSSFPGCDDGECPVYDDKKTKTLTSSSTGSGNAFCEYRDIYASLQEIVWQERKLCYDDTQSGKKWQNCKWHKDIGSIPDGVSGPWCRSACPAGTVRVAMGMAQPDDECDPASFKAFCCDDQYTVEKKYTNPQPHIFKDALDSYLVDGSCPSEASLTTRDVLVTDWDLFGPDSKGLVARSKTDAQSALFYLKPILAILFFVEATDYSPVQAANAAAWNTWVTAHKWSNLVMDTLGPFVQSLSETFEMGTEFVTQSILCRPGDWDQMVDNKEDSICSGDICDTDADPALCYGDDDDWLLQRRFSLDDFNNKEKTLLAKEPHKFKVWSANDDQWQEGLTYYHLGYPSAGDWDITSNVYKTTRSYESRVDCGNPFVFPQIKSGHTFATEHILEIQCVGLFFEAATKGTLGSKKTPQFRLLDSDFFLDEDAQGISAFNADVLNIDRAFYTGDPGESVSRKPSFRIMGALGSKTNNANFYILEAVVNGMKARIFGNKNLVEPTKWTKLTKDVTEPGRPLKAIKSAIAVWHYLADAEVDKSFGTIEANLRAVLQGIDDDYWREDILVPAWKEWWCDWTEYQFERSRTWIFKAIKDLRAVWTDEPDTDPARIMILNTLLQLEGYASAVVQFDNSKTFKKACT
ncbi:Glycoside hydrolase, superfamily [Penicillium expansum]|uniref:chitinase n=1 Tax=Penicillium expansum TaxID=27334 RepID=A0A0A2KH25_PENEN|nr:Glycoside hydrolase, superfamily [Penicillium expansum]KGO47650.1 Glycoside hydrolase, superfamily [Penicillium expansum]KGO61103.1 Glycoside hydrolase, superfamily [Penicillium expansum]KGO66181.1 Glycoside hydrolase, superfamily [Penicillium expansum]